EGGHELSIGQWQKVALARALMANSRCVVLDEPASAMDARSEQTLFGSLKDRLEGRSALLISHRLRSLQIADLIHVLGGGRIIESGRFDDLMAKEGAFFEMFRSQLRQS
ncbi:MAG: ATP-binding cassette domain-containing protein, partial [Pseudomonadota bacterium]